MNSSKIKAVLVNYDFTPKWLFDYEFDYTIFDRSGSKEYLKDFPQEKIIYTPNIGNVDLDKLRWLVDHYDNLPEVFLWGKSNLFKYITREEFDALPHDRFTPLLTQSHKTYSDKFGPVCYYQDGMYYERNDSWYMGQFESKYAHNWSGWAKILHLPSPAYLPFPPGGNFILTREVVHRYGRDMYEAMASMLDYCQLPGEAQLAERTYYLLWR